MWAPYVYRLAATVSPVSGLDPAWITAFLSLTLAVTGCIAWGLRWGWRALSRVTRFLDDFMGEPARAGVAERPGVMARLQSLTEEVTQIRAQVIPNGGSSLRDAVDRVSMDLKLVAEDLTEHRNLTGPAIGQLTADVAELRRRVELFETERAVRDDDLGERA